jgi:hypothetical protein
MVARMAAVASIHRAATAMASRELGFADRI